MCLYFFHWNVISKYITADEINGTSAMQKINKDHGNSMTSFIGTFEKNPPVDMADRIIVRNTKAAEI
jgi:hypothetical protein